MHKVKSYKGEYEAIVQEWEKEGWCEGDLGVVLDRLGAKVDEILIGIGCDCDCDGCKAIEEEYEDFVYELEMWYQ